jgi:hypothetical protein
MRRRGRKIGAGIVDDCAWKSDIGIARRAALVVENAMRGRR